VSQAERLLSPAVIEALTYWPDVAHAVPPEPVDLRVLPPLFNELLDEWPWWDRTWRVSEVRPAWPREIVRDEPPGVSMFIEVTVPGTVTRDTADALPLSARVRFRDDRLTLFQAKIGHVVVGPGSAVTGAPEPHPFGPVLSALMDWRGISVKEMAIRCKRSMSTIMMVRAGVWNPYRVLVAELATALDMPEKDLLAVAGLDIEP
jgi:hypothetical protein